MSNTTPPGWYDDGQGGRRWWDGSQWAAPGQGPSEVPAQPTPPTQQLPQQTPAYGAPQGGAPSYGQQPGGYGQQPGHGAPTQPKKKKTGLIIGIIVGLVLIGGAVVAAIFLLGGSGGASSDDPAETVQNFVDASKDGDCDQAKELLTESAREKIGSSCGADIDAQAKAAGIDPDDVTIEVGDAKEAGDEASVPVTVSTGGDEPFELEYLLTKQDGEWLIDDFTIAGLDIPDGLPSGIPTDGLPSGIPTDGIPSLPPGIPTELPPGFPTEFPTEFPTDPADIESYLEDLQSQFPPGTFPSDSPS